MQTQDAAGNAAVLIEQRAVIDCNHFCLTLHGKSINRTCHRQTHYSMSVCHGFYDDLVESTPPPRGGSNSDTVASSLS
jgi:hypothetical protein